MAIGRLHRIEEWPPGGGHTRFALAGPQKGNNRFPTGIGALRAQKTRKRIRLGLEQVLCRATAPALTRTATTAGGYRHKIESPGLDFMAQPVQISLSLF